MKSKHGYYELRELSDLLSKPESEKIVLCDRLTSVQVLTICADSSANHVVQKSNVLTDVELKLSSVASDSPAKFIKFPLSVITGTEEPSLETENQKTGLSCFLSKPEEKDELLENIEKYLQQFCKRRSVIDDIRLAADELITNCLFNAPYVNSENSNASVDRDITTISIDPLKKPHVFAGYDNNRVIIGCTDYYGRLNITKLIERIKLCYINNPGNMINFEAGGAGIGSYLVFETCMSYYVAVDPDKATTICCAFPVNMSAKERNDVPKNVHIILNHP